MAFDNPRSDPVRTDAAAQGAPPGRAFSVTNRMVLAIAIPMTLAYLTTPLQGLVDIGVVGQLGDPAAIGGLAIGAIIFDLVFTTFNFLRAATTGLVAQAVGADDRVEEQAVFWRSLVTGLSAGTATLILSPLIIAASIWFMDPGPGVREATETYVAIRILSAPLALGNYAILGYLLGRGQSGAGLALQALINGINIVLSLWLGLRLGWGIEGVALATVIGEAAGFLAGLTFVVRQLPAGRRPSLARLVDRRAVLRLMALNRDIMIRSFVLLGAFALFTRTSAQFGAVTLAANAILMNIFLVAGYYLDGFATAAEQIVGRAIGARHRPAFDRAIRLTLLWGFVLSAASAAFFLVFGSCIIAVMTTAEDVRAQADIYLAWAALTALTGVLAFQMDGVFIGATWSADMRNMMLLSFTAFIAAIWLLVPVFGNHGLWFALHVFLGLRGVSLLAMMSIRVRQTFETGRRAKPHTLNR